MLEGGKRPSLQQMQKQSKTVPEKNRGGPPRNSQGGAHWCLKAKRLKAKAQNLQSLDYLFSRTKPRYTVKRLEPSW